MELSFSELDERADNRREVDAHEVHLRKKVSEHYPEYSPTWLVHSSLAPKSDP